jgi:mono/diheme cytochrome c family protein
MFEKSPELATYLGTLFWFLPLLFIAALAMTIRMPNGLQKVAAFGVVAIAFVYFGAFEFVREGGRRPFILYDHMYSNQVYLSDVPAIRQAGFLQTAKWTRHTSVTPENQQEVGADLFRIQCSSCHSIAGPLNDIKPLVRKYDSVFGLDAKLNGLGKITRYMPPFFGDRAERWALAGYLLSINGHPLPDPVADLNMGNPVVVVEELPVAIPPFDRASDKQVLLAWSSLGMREISDSDDVWTIAAPGSDIFAQLVRRGDPPQRVTSGVDIHYQMEQDPQVNGVFQVDESRQAFVANAVAVPAYLQDGSYHPYPLLRVSAIDSSSGAVLASTRMVVPVATEMGCKNCHGGGWKVAGVTGISDATAEDVLAVHDRISGTNLLPRARQGEPQACKSCHGDPAAGQAGDPALLNFSAAIHGWHANFLTDRSGSQACVACHAARPDGPTHFFREHHGAFMDCSNCHGTLEQHAVSLLKQEELAGKSGATILLEELSTSGAVDATGINPRTPWLQQPDCLNCHEEFGLGMSVDAFNTWTDSAEDLYRNRQDQMGVMMCQACHGSTHALYPAHNKYGRQRDIIQPLQYQGNDRPLGEDCTLCHTVQPEFEGHHPNSLRL